MSAETFAPIIYEDFLENFYSRRLLLHTAYQPPTMASPPFGDAHEASHSHAHQMSFDANVVMVLSVLLCALVCSLGLHSIIRCLLRYSSEASEELTVRMANTGVKRKALKSFQTVSYSKEMNLPGLDTECVICLSEFVAGERVKLLPKCHHGFHVRCIDKWLSSHSSCPTCRDCLIQACQKIAGCSETTSSSNQPPQGSFSVHIAPLGPERFIHGF
ncbi:hypothetical protein Bca101_072925 [Brassica carinata]